VYFWRFSGALKFSFLYKLYAYSDVGPSISVCSPNGELLCKTCSKIDFLVAKYTTDIPAGKGRVASIAVMFVVVARILTRVAQNAFCNFITMTIRITEKLRFEMN
jgi:hypothetical protein